MNIIQFLKLLKKNIIFLILIPLILGSMVWYLTRNEIRVYKSSTTIYTGIGSGLSLESQSSSRLDFFGSKMEFDNIINIFKARETHKEVALRLFAQGLSLSSWDPRFINRTNYIRLHKATPQYIKDLVVKSDTLSLETLLKSVPLVLNDTTDLRNKKIILANTWHVIEHNESLFSLSSRFNVAVSDLMDWNNLTTTTLSPGQKVIIERKQQVVFDNSFNQRDTVDLYIPDTSFFIQAEIDSTSFEKTVENFRRYADANDTNYLYRLLNKSHAHYSIGAVSKNSAKRIQGSDLVQISYTSSDPGITQQTLVFLVYSFEKYYRKLKENQSDHIVAYFERRVKESSALLVASENRLLKFNQDNNIINYYEQTRHISDQKEQLDSRYYDEKMKFNAADSVIHILESRLEKLKGVTGYNQDVLDKRNQLSEITYKIAINELNDNKDPKAVNALNDLRLEAAELKKSITSGIDSIFQRQFTPEGVSEKDIITQWLYKIIEFEESKATLAALYERKKEFQKTYEIFAPLGAKLKRIEREIDVYEQQYLQHLHSLNQAKLKQQNLEFKSNIKVVDPPYFPLRPEGSKRKIFIAAAIVVGFVLVVFIILALEYLDQTLKFPKRTEKYTGLVLAGAYPLLVSKNKQVYFEYLTNRSIQILIQNLRAMLQRSVDSEKKPIKILVFSTQKTDGKSLIQEELCNNLRKFEHSVLSMNYKIDAYNPKYRHEVTNQEDYVEYVINDSFFNKTKLPNLFIDEEIPRFNVYDYVVMELPSIVHNPFPPELMKEFDIAIMVARANRTWLQADMKSLKSIKEFLLVEPVVVLNGTNPEYLQELVGEIPKKRSRLRRIIKKIVRLQVFERYQLKKW